MSRPEKKTIQFVAGFKMSPSTAVRVSEKLNYIGDIEFEVSEDKHCTIFTSIKPVSTSIERYIRLHSFFDGMKFGMMI